MSGMVMVSRKTFSIARYVMSDDIDDIQEPRYHMSRRTCSNLLVRYYVRGFAWACMATLARNASPSGRASLNPPSTCHEPRPGPKPAYWVRAVSLCATEPRARGKTRSRVWKKCRRVKKNTHIYVQSSPSGCMWNVKPRGWRKLMEGTRRKHNSSHSS